MAGEVKLPGVGGVSHKALWIGGGAAVLVMGVLWWRKRSAAAAAPAADSTTDPSLDPSLDTGIAGGGGALVSDFPGGGVASPTSNPQWTAVVMQDLSGVADPSALASALGLYLTGGAVNTDQTMIIDQAIAVAGYPPVAGPSGYPPAIRTQAGGGQTTPTPPVTSSTPPAAKPPAPAKPPAAARYVTVGHYGVDPSSITTLSGIAAANHTTVSALMHLNPSITNPNVIHPGQKIRVA